MHTQVYKQSQILKLTSTYKACWYNIDNKMCFDPASCLVNNILKQEPLFKYAGSWLPIPAVAGSKRTGSDGTVWKAISTIACQV